ncbi:MAG: cytochrome P460 family protein [Bryobacteraceae bacterium]
MRHKIAFVVAPALLAAAVLLGTGPSQSDGPQFNAKGELLFPANYREWVFLSSGLGMNYGPLAAKGEETPRFDNVFVTPSAYKSFLETGRWPDKTMLLIEVRSSESKGSINKAGHYQSDLAGIEAEVKDESRFPGKWAFFSFGDGTSPTGKQRPGHPEVSRHSLSRCGAVQYV